MAMVSAGRAKQGPNGGLAGKKKNAASPCNGLANVTTRRYTFFGEKVGEEIRLKKRSK